MILLWAGCWWGSFQPYKPYTSPSTPTIFTKKCSRQHNPIGSNSSSRTARTGWPSLPRRQYLSGLNCDGEADESKPTSDAEGRMVRKFSAKHCRPQHQTGGLPKVLGEVMLRMNALRINAEAICQCNWAGDCRNCTPEGDRGLLQNHKHQLVSSILC